MQLGRISYYSSSSKDWAILFWILAGPKYFPFPYHPDRLWDLPSLHSLFTEKLLRAHSGWGVKPAVSLPSQQGLGMSQSPYQFSPKYTSISRYEPYIQTDMSSMTCYLLIHIVWRVHNKCSYVLLPLSKASGPAMGLTQPSIRWVSGVNRPGREADHSPYLAPRLRMSGALLSSPPHKP